MTTDGLPGTVTPYSLTLPRRLPLEEWRHALGLLGNMAAGVTWWIADALLYGEATYGEQFAQDVDLVGINPKTATNIMAVARALPPARRRADLSFGHHQAIAILDSEDQNYWLDRAEQGDELPAGGRARWSVSRLRTELRALGSGGSGESDPSASHQPPLEAPLIAEGREISVRWAAEGVVRYVVERVERRVLSDLVVTARRA